MSEQVFIKILVDNNNYVIYKYLILKGYTYLQYDDFLSHLAIM